MTVEINYIKEMNDAFGRAHHLYLSFGHFFFPPLPSVSGKE
jgi:hypothetical protein